MNARCSVRVQPRSTRNAIERQEDGRLKVWVTAPPADNEANEAVCALIAKTLKVAKRSVKIVRGHSSRNKEIEIEGIDQDEANRRIG
ncbi:MAG: DUF167 domain-containing protein [Fimbriimonadaceae bacterium]|nr:DUF167 domain-containing protein [Chthonomonadaceae bacterium]MCO5296091.1 DUF167 domain-containing protein [Fimbriimonadaceae bacterium]